MMIRHTLATACLALSSLAAHAGLTTISGDGWPPAGSSGLDGVLFNVQTNGNVTVAMGAHAYKNSATMPNDGQSVFYGQSGLYAPDGKGYANWSFDFAWNLGTCTDCTVTLGVVSEGHTASQDLTALGSVYADSWNLEMSFIPFAFDAFDPSSSVFTLTVSEDTRILESSQITVDVPEPATLALTGLALGAMGFAARRRKSS